MGKLDTVSGFIGKGRSYDRRCNLHTQMRTRKVVRSEDGYLELTTSDCARHFYLAYPSAKSLYDACLEYFRNPGVVKRIYSTKNGPVTVEIPAPYSLEGLCHHLHVSRDLLERIYGNAESFGGHYPVVEWAKSRIAASLIEQSLAGNYASTLAWSLLKSYLPDKFRDVSTHEKSIKKQTTSATLNYDLVKIEGDGGAVESLKPGDDAVDVAAEVSDAAFPQDAGSGGAKGGEGDDGGVPL